jgi:hypothetical protein
VLLQHRDFSIRISASHVLLLKFYIQNDATLNRDVQFSEEYASPVKQFRLADNEEALKVARKP